MTGERGVQEGALWEGEDKEEPEGSRDLWVLLEAGGWRPTGPAGPDPVTAGAVPGG